MRRLSIASVAAVLALAATGCADSRTASGSPNDCAACHAFPPAGITAHATAPGGTWEATECAACHPTSVDAATGDVLPTSEGGTHANGSVDGGGHPVPWDAVGESTNHGAAANAGLAACTTCHGTNLDGGSANQSCDECHTGGTAWRTNCTFCHGDPARAATPNELSKSAPPEDVGGATAVTAVTVGVHLAHVTAENPVACQACHSADGTTPADIFSAGHVDASPAEVPFGALAKTRGRAPAWNRTAATCASTWCHDQGGSLATPNWTVAGAVGCGSCHPAAPTTNAHTAHLSGETYSNGFACGSCHTIPASTSHLDGTVGVGFANAVVPGGTFASGACSSVYCHGATLTGGTTPSPTWAGAIDCSSCHGVPPGTGRHVLHDALDCGTCHSGFSATTVDKARHVDGSVDMTSGCHGCASGW